MTNPSTFFKKHQLYAITIAPDDNKQFFGKINRYNLFLNYINELFIHYKPIGIHYKLYIELSEPKNAGHNSNGPRLHCHGVLKFFSNKSITKFLLTEYYKLTRTNIIDFDTVDNTDKWKLYCEKQQGITKFKQITNHPEMF